MWRRLRAVVPEREGLLIFDGTSFPKQGPHSVGVARRSCGALGKIAELPSGRHRSVVDGSPRLSARGRAVFAGGLGHRRRPPWARIPAPIRFQEKWRQALTLLRQVRASGFTVTGVLADAEFGDNRVFRGLLHRLRLPYALGISSHLTVFLGTPRLPDGPPGAARTAAETSAIGRGASARPLGEALVAAGARWRRLRWRNRPHARTWTVDCVAIRVTPAVDCRHRRLMPEIWLLAERDVGDTPRTKYYFVHLPPTASLVQIVRLAHHRWAIEQQYQDLKTELGLDRFEGRTFAGWHHHVVLTAIAYNFLQAERQRARVESDVSQRAWHRAGNLHRILVCPATALPHPHRGAAVRSTPDLTKWSRESPYRFFYAHDDLCDRSTRQRANSFECGFEERPVG